MASNQLSAKELEELKRLYQQIDGLTQSQAEAEAIRAQNLGNAHQQLIRLRKEYHELTSDISTSLNIFQQITQEISRQNLGLSESKKGYKGLTSIAEKLQQYQQGIIRLSSSDIDKMEKKYEIEKLRLTNAQQLLDQNKLEQENKKRDNLTAQQDLENRIRAARANNQYATDLIYQLRTTKKEYKNINGELKKIEIAYENNKAIIDDTDEGIKSLNNTLTKTKDAVKDVEKMMGLSGAAVGSIETALDKLGLKNLSKALGVSDAKEKMQSLAEQIQKDKERALELETEIAAGITDSAVLRAKQAELNALKAGNAGLSETEAKRKILKEGIGSMKKSIVENLKDPFAIVGFLMNELITALISADKATGELAKSMNMSYDSASDLRQEMNQIANLSMDASVTTRGMQESYMAIGKSIGAQVDMNEANLVFMTQMREKAGLTNEEMVSMQNLAATTGKDVKVITKEFLGGAQAMAIQSGKALNVKQLMQETSKVSNAIKLSIKGGALGLGEAAAKAKLLGMNLEQADKIASSLLNFEDSITAELEAELLTGKNLNLERARLAALNGDLATVTEEISRNIGSAADFTNMNRLQQEAIAKSVGMTREELANTLVEQEALAKLGKDLSKEEQAAFNAAKEKYGVEQASKMLGEGQLDMMMHQQSVQERFNATVEKLREVFISIADPILQIVSPLMNLVSTVLPAINVLLTPVFFVMRSIADAVQGFTSLMNGELKSGLDGFLQIVQSIAVVWGGIVLAAKLMGKETLKNITLQGTLGSLLKKDFWTNIGTAIAKAWGSIIGFLGPFGIPVALAAGAGLVALASSFFNKAGDVSSPAKGKTRISTKEGGLYELSNNDDFAAAPGLLDNLNKPAKEYTIDTSSKSGNNSMNNAEMIALMRENNNLSKQIVENSKIKPVYNLEAKIDGDKVTTTVNNSNLVKSKMQ
jgi:hypothetical protein